jgi:predicted permease
MTGLLFQSFIPLAFLIAVGYAVGKWQRVELKSVAMLAIYGITPIVAFGSAAQLDFSFSLLLLPLCTFLLAAFVGLGAFYAGKIVANDSTRYLLPVACGSGNTGYFGLPVAMALFGDDVAGLYFLANLGVVVFETSLGYYYMARGNLPADMALRRVLQLPVLYALAAGLCIAAADLSLPASAVKLWEISKGGYIVIGMMIAGLALAGMTTLTLRPALLTVALAGKFLFWPAAALAFAALDPGLFSKEIHALILVMSLTPIPANLPAYAAANDGPVGEAAVLVFVSTLLALIFMPFILPILL